MKTGIELIAEERQEQIEKHNWTPEHDDQHTDGALIKMAGILCVNGTDAQVHDNYGEFESGSNTWGLENKLSGDKNKIHRLEVAGALIAAEIDRLQRKH